RRLSQRGGSGRAHARRDDARRAHAPPHAGRAPPRRAERRARTGAAGGHRRRAERGAPRLFPLRLGCTPMTRFLPRWRPPVRRLHAVIGLAMVGTLLSGCPQTTRPRRDAGVTRDAGGDGGMDAGGGASDAGARDAGRADAGSPDVVLAVDFEGSPLGAYSDPRVRADWPGTRFVMSSRATIVEEDGDRFVRVLYPAGGWGSSGSGAQ